MAQSLPMKPIPLIFMIHVDASGSETYLQETEPINLKESYQMMEKLKIGDVVLENNLVLAPMAGVCDLPFRVLCKEQGQGFCVWKW